MATNSDPNNPFAVLKAECEARGVSADVASYLSFIMQHESGGRNIDCIDHASKASGYFQIVDGTWHGLTGLPGRAMDYSIKQQCDAAIDYALNNARTLHANTGQSIGGGELYLAHFLGPGARDDEEAQRRNIHGAREILTADPGRNIHDILSAKVMHANAGIKFNGKHFADFTVADLRNWTNSVTDAGGYIADHNNGIILSDDDEWKRRTRILRGFGVPEKEIDTLQHLEHDGGFLGQIVFALIVHLFEMAAPRSETPLQDLDACHGLPADLPIPRPNPARASAPPH